MRQCSGLIISLAIFLLFISGSAHAIPPNAHAVENGWACNAGFRKQSQQCNKMFIPPNARLSGQNWVCNDGFERKSNQCNPVTRSVVKSKVRPSNEAVHKAESLYLLNKHDEAFEAFLPLAMQGNASAQFYLAELYKAGKGLDKSQAIYWYQKSAEQGNPNAQFNIANAYYDGKVVTTDLLKAANWYELAAQNGVPEAQLNLGYMYSTGKGVQKNDKLASSWYKLAALRGNSKAQSNLGYRYCQGMGVEKSLQRCAYWVKKALDQNHPNAKKIWRSFGLQNHLANNGKSIG